MQRIERERITVGIMIDFYCKKNHLPVSTICEQCAITKNYAFQRLEKCIFGNRKPACSDCKIHCYKPEMRENIRKIMRYSGPRMIYIFPLFYIKHYFHKLFT